MAQKFARHCTHNKRRVSLALALFNSRSSSLVSLSLSLSVSRCCCYYRCAFICRRRNECACLTKATGAVDFAATVYYFSLSLSPSLSLSLSLSRSLSLFLFLFLSTTCFRIERKESRMRCSRPPISFEFERFRETVCTSCSRIFL